MKQKKSIEDYLKVIYILSKKKEVHGSDIAGELRVSRPTVSVALKALAEEGYVFVDHAYEIHLRNAGDGLRKIPMSGTEPSGSSSQGLAWTRKQRRRTPVR